MISEDSDDSRSAGEVQKRSTALFLKDKDQLDPKVALLHNRRYTVVPLYYDMK